jgi:hypothetical protein
VSAEILSPEKCRWGICFHLKLHYDSVAKGKEADSNDMKLFINLQIMMAGQSLSVYV